MSKRDNLVQAQNPITKRFILIDTTGTIVSHKPTKGPYKHVKIVGKVKE